MSNFKNTPAYKIGRFIFFSFPTWLIGIIMETAVFPIKNLIVFTARSPLWLSGYWWCYGCGMTMKPSAYKHKLRDYDNIALLTKHCCNECLKESRGELKHHFLKRGYWRKYFID